MGNSFTTHTGKPWKNPEDNLIRSKYDSDFISPYDPKHLQPDTPLHPAKKAPSEFEEARYEKRDCLIDMIEFMRWPVYAGIGWGAAMAAVHAVPPVKVFSLDGGFSQLGSGIRRELQYLKKPPLVLGGFAALYSLSQCFASEMLEKNGPLSSGFGGLVTGISIGLYRKSTNKMFMFGVYGALLAASIKYCTTQPNFGRPQLSYFELIEKRKQQMSPRMREECEDGYIHAFLDPKLKAVLKQE